MVSVQKCDACGRIETSLPIDFSNVTSLGMCSGPSFFSYDLCSIECLRQKMREILEKRTTEKQGVETFSIQIARTIAKEFYDKVLNI